MKYTQLPENHKYEVIAAAVYARELEYFHYDFDRINFEKLIESLPDGDYKENVRERLADTMKQMRNVEAIHTALMSQIDDAEAYQLAVELVTQKREAEKCATQK